MSSSKWDKRFLDLAKHVSSWSKDPSTKVGAVIVNSDRQIVSLGYNGFARGVDDSEDRYSDRAMKYQMVVHAEANAILNANTSLKGTTCYVTHPCCSNCAALLIQAGVKTVVVTEPTADFLSRFGESMKLTAMMFEEAGVTAEVYANDS
jgi:dCMP deaminase